MRGWFGLEEEEAAALALALEGKVGELALVVAKAANPLLYRWDKAREDKGCKQELGRRKLESRDPSVPPSFPRDLEL